MHYIIGDIHGMLKNLSSLFSLLKKQITDDDTLIFLGDYIDRGLNSFEVIEYLLAVSRIYKTVFLKGNHENMFLKYINNIDLEIFIANGGTSTLSSYRKNTGNLNLPETHKVFFENLDLFYENKEFIAVHAGLNPEINNLEKQSDHDMLWIREKFFRSEKIWDKTIIFGHTPCAILHGKPGEVYIDDQHKLIGIDTGACYGGKLSCFRWPDGKIFQV
jgi:serine/threonine protein phosphatase 1